MVCGVVLAVRMMLFYRTRVRESELNRRLVEDLQELDRQYLREESFAESEVMSAEQNVGSRPTRQDGSPLTRIGNLIARYTPSTRSSRLRSSRRIETRFSDDNDFADQWLTSLFSQPISSGTGDRATDNENAEQLVNQQLQHILTHLRLSMSDGNFSPEEYDRLLRLDRFVHSPKGLNKRQIDRFPTFKVITQSSQLDDRCTICMDDYEVDQTLMTLRCFHIFHEGCIRTWLEENDKCPICMNSASTSDQGVDLLGVTQSEMEVDPVLDNSFDFGSHGQTFVDL